MKRFWEIALIALLTISVLPCAAAKNSQDYVLGDNVRVGDLQISHGAYNVTWTEASDSQVQLTLKGDHQKPITLPARVIAEKHQSVGTTTFTENGMTYLQDIHTKTQTFILSGATGAAK